MRRGTTPTLTFTTPYEAAMIQSGYLTFTQRGAIVLDLPLSDPSITIEDNAIKCTLTQENTLAMTTAAPCEAQIRAILQSGSAVASNIVDIPVCAILKEGEI